MKNLTQKKTRIKLKHSSNGVAKFLSLPYKIELFPISKKVGGGYLATIPLLQGCQSDGSTPDEAVYNLREAQRAWIESALKHGDEIPKPR